jgi:hypothetical protein
MGIRDEAKILGGLGVCGRPFCCHSFLPDFVQVSIKMAKEQNLSLNSAKISGACGRLMCCLRYEYETYCEEAKLTPKLDSLVRTPDGVAKVVETKPLLGLVKVQMVNTPDAAPVVYSRDLLKPLKPGESTDDPPQPIEPKEKTPKPAEQKEQKKQDAPAKPHQQSTRKHKNDNTERKKPLPESNKPERSAKQEVTEPAEKAEKAEPAKTERRYSIQRASDTAKNENAPIKKHGSYHHRRKNHPPRDQKDK